MPETITSSPGRACDGVTVMVATGAHAHVAAEVHMSNAANAVIGTALRRVHRFTQTPKSDGDRGRRHSSRAVGRVILPPHEP